MKNIVKLFGIIALAAVIGFSIAGCKTAADDATTGSDIDWVGTWKLTAYYESGNPPAEPAPSITIKADKSWTIDDTNVSGRSGAEWEYKHDPFGLGGGWCLILTKDNGYHYLFVAEKIDSTHVKLSSTSVTPGTYAKQP